MNLEFSAFDPPLEEQLKRCGLEIKNVEKYEKIKKSILMLWFHGYITDLQKEKMVNKFFKEIKSNTIRTQAAHQCLK